MVDGFFISRDLSIKDNVRPIARKIAAISIYWKKLDRDFY
jgi:hypothetical protein